MFWASVFVCIWFSKLTVFFSVSEWERTEGREELSDLLHGQEAVLSDHAVLPGWLGHLHMWHRRNQHFLFTGGLRCDLRTPLCSAMLHLYLLVERKHYSLFLSFQPHRTQVGDTAGSGGPLHSRGPERCLHVWGLSGGGRWGVVQRRPQDPTNEHHQDPHWRSGKVQGRIVFGQNTIILVKFSTHETTENLSFDSVPL